MVKVNYIIIFALFSGCIKPVDITLMKAGGNATKSEVDRARQAYSWEIDLSTGHSDNYLFEAVYQSKFSNVSLSSMSVVNQFSTPMASSSTYSSVSMDEGNDLLYVYGYSGLDVFDMNGTADLGDDIHLATFDSTSTPSVPDLYSWNVFHDEITGLLYLIGYNSGVHVVDTLGNGDPSDDIKLGVYNNSGTPTISTNNNRGFFKAADGLLFIYSYSQGLDVIDTKNTATFADDVFVGNYKNNSTVNLSNTNIMDISYSETQKVLYVLTSSGVDVLDFNGTISDGSDDFISGRYNSGTVPSITAGWGYGIEYDQDSGYIYLAMDGNSGTIEVIDTNMTPSIADDLVLSLEVANSCERYSWFDEILFDATRETITLVSDHENTLPIVIKTKGTNTFTDDTIDCGGYNLSLASNVKKLIYSESYDTQILLTESGANLVNSDQNLSGSFLTPASDLSLWSITHAIAFDSITPGNSQLSAYISFSDYVFDADLDDGDVSNVVDPYSWGGGFSSVVESSGRLVLSGVAGSGYGDQFIDTGGADDWLPGDSQIEIKVRAVTGSNSKAGLCIFTDEWENRFNCEPVDQEFKIIRTIPGSDFRYIGIEAYWEEAHWDTSTDYFEIDYIRIIRESDWEAYTPLINFSRNSSSIDRTKDAFRIKIDLSTNNSGELPILNQIFFYETN